MAEKIWVATHHWGAGGETVYMVSCAAEPEGPEVADIINKHGGLYEPEGGDFITWEKWDGTIYSLKMNRTRSVIFSKKFRSAIMRAMEDKEPLEGVSIDYTYSERVSFGGGYVVEIVVCNSRYGVWVDVILSLGGQEVGRLDSSFNSVFGEYIFTHDGHKLTTVIEKGKKEDEMPKQRMTDKEYVRHRGLICPYCRERTIEGGDSSFDGWEAIVECKCTSCGKEWNELYRLVGFMEDENDKG